MLSRREKLLIRPWEARRYNDHKRKVQSVLPTVDNHPPQPRPHVTFKLKKFQKELDRKNKIQSDNQSLLQRLNAIMKVNRLDNRWTRPLPNSHQKVGLFYDAESLNSRLRSLGSAHDSDVSYSNVKCYACDIRKKDSMQYNKIDLGSAPNSVILPSIY